MVGLWLARQSRGGDRVRVAPYIVRDVILSLNRVFKLNGRLLNTVEPQVHMAQRLRYRVGIG